MFIQTKDIFRYIYIFYYSYLYIYILLYIYVFLKIYKGFLFEKSFSLASIRYTTFNEVYKRRWKDILQFRQKSLFSQCEVCWTLKNQLNSKTLSLDQKLGCLHQYRDHLHDQFCDRTVIWKLQAESADPNTDFVIISTDGLDQSKFSLPRDPHLKASAALSFELISTCFLVVKYLYFLIFPS